MHLAEIVMVLISTNFLKKNSYWVLKNKTDKMFTIVKCLKNKPINSIKISHCQVLLNLNLKRQKASKQADQLNFFDGKLKYETKVPQTPYTDNVTVSKNRDIIDEETLLLLERLSLVNVEDR